MKILVSILVGLFLTTNSYAAEVTVGKVSKTGKKAVIYIPEGMTVEKGQTLLIGGGETTEQVALPSGTSPRNKSIGGNFEFYSDTIETTAGSSTTSTDQTTIGFEALYLVNKVNFEFGGGLNYSSTSTTTVKTSGYGLLGVFEYNFMPNKPGASVVAHVGGELSYSSGSTETNTGGKSDTSGLGYGVYGGIKYFIVPSSGFAITANVGYAIDNALSSDSVDISISRLALKAGVRYYF